MWNATRGSRDLLPFVTICLRAPRYPPLLARTAQIRAATADSSSAHDRDHPGQPTLRRTGLVSLPGAQRVKQLQCLGHGLDPDLAAVHPGTRLFRRS